MTIAIAPMVTTLKIYIAGKVSPNSVFGTHNWRDNFCIELSQKSGFNIINLDPTKSHDGFVLDEKNSKLIFGRDCFMIEKADLVVVYLTDDISVGGSQEMLIAKYYEKPLIGIAPKEGKFNKKKKEILGVVYKDWVHPFVSVPCDTVTESIDGAASFIKNFFLESPQAVKGLSIIDESVEYYKKEYHHLDRFLQVD